MSHPPSEPNPQSPGGPPPGYGTQQPFEYNTGATGNKRKKKGGCLKILGIIVGLFLLLILLVAACSTMGSKSTDAQSAGSTPSSPAATTSSADASAETPAAPVEESPEAVATTAPSDGPSSPDASPTQSGDGDVPREYTSALKSAETYSKMMHMSKAGIYDQLTSEYGEKFTPDAAQYAIDNITADWNANALASAKNYQETMNMSPAAIQDQLTSEYGEKFTPEQAAYAVQHLDK